MNNTTQNDGLALVRGHLQAAVGREIIAALHRKNPLLDAMAVTLSVSLFVLNAAALAWLSFGVLWIACFVLQGFLLQFMGLVSHDLFVHRRVWGDSGSWLASIILTLPRFSLPTGYEQAHLAHHRWIGTECDTEAYKQQLDTRRKRWLFATLPGIKLAQAVKLQSSVALKHYHDVTGQGARLEKRAHMEKILLCAFLLSLSLLAWFFPAVILLGYLLPVLIMGPIVNTLRIIIEHGDANPDNPFHWSTWYRTGPFTRLLFFWDSGDCHVIHHIYPRLPFYHMNRAVALMGPVLLAQGVVERRSYLQLLHGWFVAAYAHRSVWPLTKPSSAPLSSLS